jgi:CHAT domain-containing protein
MDNLRGLTANLFMAGAKTVVGTLWPIETNAAQIFFVEFYRAISEGRSKLVAFEKPRIALVNAPLSTGIGVRSNGRLVVKARKHE